MTKRKSTPKRNALSELSGLSAPPTPPLAEQGEGKKKGQRGAREGLARIQYDIPKELKKQIHERAVEIGVPDSQLAAYLMKHGMELLESGKIDPTPHLEKSTSPKFRFNLFS